MIDGGDCSMVNGCENRWVAAWVSLGAISIYIMCLKKAVQHVGITLFQMFSLRVFFWFVLGFSILDDFGDKTLSCCSLNNPSNWPVKPISEDAKLCPGIVFRLSSLTITKALIRLDCLLLIGCDVLLDGFHSGVFFFSNEIWRILRFIKKAS